MVSDSKFKLRGAPNAASSPGRLYSNIDVASSSSQQLLHLDRAVRV